MRTEINGMTAGAVTKGAIWGLAVCWIISLLAGCRSVRHVPVETVRTDSVYAGRWHRDSVYVRDSVFVSQRVKGDTVWLDRVAVRVEYRDRALADTVATVRADTIRVPYAVERELTWRERISVGAFPWLVLAVAALCAAVLYQRRGE